ncbi:hypothetical protein [Burkholderia puraquae]|uniref:hypothetical protein n=1 Tax=Burkholderia puraquae TaxID=1904757 RepID=UPI0010566F0E|nr:hypothetical protein [Burkholderia puraquae]
MLVCIAGNQPVETEHALRALGVQADIVASSAPRGAEKPSARFFERIIAERNGLDPAQIACICEPLDNHVEPARRACMVSAFVRRGPWALIQSCSGRFATSAHVMDDLSSLPDMPSGI